MPNNFLRIIFSYLLLRLRLLVLIGGIRKEFMPVGGPVGDIGSIEIVLKLEGRLRVINLPDGVRSKEQFSSIISLCVGVAIPLECNVGGFSVS